MTGARKNARGNRRGNGRAASGDEHGNRESVQSRGNASTGNKPGPYTSPYEHSGHSSQFPVGISMFIATDNAQS
jgi:hypothetical protein